MNADVVDRQDVRMVEAARRLGLLLEPAKPIGSGGEAGGQHFDGDVAFQARVTRPIDLAHPPRAERGEDLVGAQTRAGWKRHGGRRLSKNRGGEG